jgi:hypothetical protein
MPKDHTRIVSALFRTRQGAEDAIATLIRHGFHREDIGLLLSDHTRNREFAVEATSHATDGLGIGSAIGGTVGAIVAALVAVGSSLSVPGIGLLVAGPLAAALAGAGAGGLTGGLVGALVGAGIPEHRARAFASGMRRGGILVVVEAANIEQARRIQDDLEHTGGRGVHQGTTI